MLVILPCETQNWIECKDLFTLLSEVSTLEELSGLISAHAGKVGPLAYSLGCLEGLCLFLKQFCSEDERTGFFSRTFPCIIRTAACLEELTPASGIPFLTQQEAASIVLRRNLVASLLANALLCTFPSGHLVDAGIVPFNFDKFLAIFVSDPQLARQQAAKMKCILSYFDRLFELGGDIKGTITFKRQVIACSDVPSLVAWALCERPLCPVLVDHTHGTEAAPFDTLQVDFANCNSGGGVLDYGCLQEEIRFCVSPELLVSVLIMDRMDANEAIIVTGAERFSECRGHGEALEFVGPYHDTAMRDPLGTLLTSVVAIDATPFTWNSDKQYEDCHILRELNKAYTGFVCQQLTSDLADCECGPPAPPDARPTPPDARPTPPDASGCAISHPCDSVVLQDGGLVSQDALQHGATIGNIASCTDIEDSTLLAQESACVVRNSTIVPFSMTVADGLDPTRALGNGLIPTDTTDKGLVPTDTTDKGLVPTDTIDKGLVPIPSCCSTMTSSHSSEKPFDDVAMGSSTMSQYVQAGISGGGVSRSTPPNAVVPRPMLDGTGIGMHSEPLRYKVPTKGPLGVTASDRKLHSDGQYLDPGMGMEPAVLLNPLLLGVQSSRTSYAWSVASTFDETSRPVSPNELNRIALSLVSSLEEYASMLAENIVAEAIASLPGCASVPMVTSLLEEKDQLEAATEVVSSSPLCQIDAFLNTLGSAEPLPNQNDRLSMYSLRWHSAALRPVATGNWGCGTLGGNVQLKALIQWMAVSASGRPAMMYFTDQNQDLQQLPGVVARLLARKWTVGQLCQSVQDYTSGYQEGRRDSSLLACLLDQ